MKGVARALGVAALLLLGGTGFTQDPAQTRAESVFPDIQRILDRGVLRVAVLAVDAPPMIMTGPDGGLRGSEADLARDLGEKMTVEVDLVRTAATYDEVVELVSRGEADIAVSFLSGSVDRASRVLLSRAYVQQSGRLFFNRARFAALRRQHGVESLEALWQAPGVPQLTVGVLAGSVYQTALLRESPGVRRQAFDSLEDLMQAVHEGRVFAGLHGSLQIDYYMRRNPVTAIRVGIDPEVRMPSDIRIAVRPDSPNLLRWVNLYLANHVGMLDAADIVQRYLDGETD